jgi:Acyclic terpene utilisation family protein AtuA
MKPPLRIANGAGFLGDWLDAPKRLVERAEVDYLTIEHLAELTMSILARQREKDPNAGYAEDFLDILRSLVPALKQQPQLKIVANSGGMNPPACARAAAKILAEAGLGETAIGCVTGDDLLPRISEVMAAGGEFTNLDTGEPLARVLAPAPSPQPLAPLVSANAYLGARPIADALAGGARIVITGRVADASLTVGPAMHHFGWAWDDWDRLAAASVAGHLIECGAQVTGGYSVNWQDYSLGDVSYPIAEIAEDGSCVITKPLSSGGTVNRRTVVEQLVYEIGDPQHYLTPDVDCDFTTVEVEELDRLRVAVRGATGRPATDTYKVSMAYRDGWMASGQLLVYGPDCAEKAKVCAEIIRHRCKMARHTFDDDKFCVEFLGYGAGVPGAWFWRKYQTPGELVLRVTAHDPRREAIECFAKQFAPLITSGPAGLAGYAAGRPQVRPVFAYWPTLVPKALAQSQVEVRTAQEWAP